MSFRWENSQEIKHFKKALRKRAIYEKSYYEGFNVGREEAMFKEELDALERVYLVGISQTCGEIESVLPSLLHYMEKFVDLHKDLEGVEEKLDVLREKMGKNKEEKEDE